jgi:hypothetical protein
MSNVLASRLPKSLNSCTYYYLRESLEMEGNRDKAGGFSPLKYLG